MRFGAIDIGTNSIHVVVVELDPYVGSIHTIFKAREMVRLGAGDALTFSSGHRRSRLGKKALARGIEVIAGFVARARTFGVADLRIVATSAVRDAENQSDFTESVTARTGYRVEVLSGRDEARLIHLGVSRGNELDERLACIIDIGGGSTEIIIADRLRTYALHSLPIGSLRMYERFRRGENLDIEALDAYVHRVIEPVCAPLRSGEALPGEARIERVIGTSGTWLSLAALDAGRRGVEFSRSAGADLELTQMLELQECMAVMSGDERRAMPGMNPRRSDIILSGNAIAIALLRALGQEEVRVCDYALREGIIVDYLQSNHDRVKALGDGRLRRLDAVRELARRLHGDVAHETRVADFVLALYDGMNEHSRFETADRDVLFGAAILHDVGYAVNASSHHKHGAYIVRNAPLLGWSPPEREMLALLVRYHRGSLPKLTHPEYTALDQATRENVDALAALLRIADGLDATHRGIVRSVEMKRARDRSTIVLHAGGDATAEIDSARAKADLFARTYGSVPKFEVVAIEEPNE